MKDLVVRQHDNYFLSHSVGLPFVGAEENFSNKFFHSWQTAPEPWPLWIDAIDEFRVGVATLLNTEMDLVCPQVNLSSALTKVLSSLPSPDSHRNVILYSEAEFPSMGFVLQHAAGYEPRAIPDEVDLLQADVWSDYLLDDVSVCFLGHVQSNNGRQLPIADVTRMTAEKGIVSIVDIAQSVGVIPINLGQWTADFVLGSCVKWLCGGPGAGFLWVSPKRLPHCEPKDVGWFSHRDPYEFDIRNFELHETALKFWGGTPSVAPFVNAGYAISKINQLGVETIRNVNLKRIEQIQQAIDAAWVVSPINPEQCGGTLILHGGDKQAALVSRLDQSSIAYDSRRNGVRLSPHFYTTEKEIEVLQGCLAY